MVAMALEDAAHDEDRLEAELVACFDSMGYEAILLSGKDNPDGKATAYLGGSQRGESQAYAVSLEAKSKQQSGGRVSAKDIGISGVVRHRDEFGCDHTVVVASEFPTGEDDAVVLREARADREACGLRAKARKGRDASITLVRIADLARLVRLVAAKFITLDRLREFFWKCLTPNECKLWIDALAAEEAGTNYHQEILEVIWEEQKGDPLQSVEFSAVRVALRMSKNIQIEQADLIATCQALAMFARNTVRIRSGRSIELRTRPDKVMEEVSESLRKLPAAERKASAFRL
jgi:hypothetical protein